MAGGVSSSKCKLLEIEILRAKALRMTESNGCHPTEQEMVMTPSQPFRVNPLLKERESNPLP